MGLLRVQKKEQEALTTPRIYVPRVSDDEDHISLGNDNLNYIKNVLRLKPGDPVIVFDGRRFEYETIIDNFSSDSAILKITKKNEVSHSEISITLAQSVPKAGKMEFIIQKATELGITKIVPVISRRSIPKFSETKMTAKVSRWRKIAVEASRQCGRAVIPDITDIFTFDKMVKLPGENDHRIILWEEETTHGLKTILQDGTEKNRNDFFIVVGPEGGFTREEVELARINGFTSATLGTYILRTETVGLAVLSILQYERGMFGNPGKGERDNG